LTQVAYDAQDLWLAAAFGILPWIVNALSFLGGYILGSIPFGYVFNRWAGAGDIRTIGSGNIGATNVLRTGRRGLAFLTLIADACKALLPILFCRYYLGGVSPIWAAAGAFTGHLFPVWLGFRGGKGVATYIGILAGLFPAAAALFCAIWLSVAYLSRYSSLAALLAASATALFVIFAAPYQLAGLIVILSAALILKHHKNIRNLIAGHESKIGQRAS